MGGISIALAGSNIMELSKEIQKSLSEHEKNHLFLDSDISIVKKEMIEAQIKSKKGKEVFLIYPRLANYLKDETKNWFAFFHVHT